MPEISEYRHGVPSWVDVSTPDLEATGAFYGALFGWELGPDLGPDAGGYRMLTLRGKEVAGVGPQMPGAPPSWSTYLSVDSLDDAVAKVGPAGGTVVVPPMDLPNESGRMAFVVDPTGGFVGLFQRGAAHYGSKLVNETGTPVWNELTVRDQERALAFYADVLGWTTEPMEGSDDYQLVKVQGRVTAGSMRMAGDEWPADLPTHWMVYFAVDDADATAARAAELGGTVMVPPTDIAIGRFAVLNDPNGAVFSVIALQGEPDDPNNWP
jgi:predicted enzyme related to lactoylglutathione lyase